MLNLQEMPEWKSADSALVKGGWAMSIRHAPTDYVALENQSVRWGRIEDLSEQPQGVPTEVIPLLQKLATKVREQSEGKEDIRALGIEMYPGDWEGSLRGLHISPPEYYQPTGDEVTCPKCKNLLDFRESQNSKSQMEGQTEHYCVGCGEMFWRDESGKITSWTEMCSGPGVLFVDDFSQQDIPRQMEDYKFRKLLDGSDDDEAGS